MEYFEMYRNLKDRLESPPGKTKFTIYDYSRCADGNLYNHYDDFFRFAIANRSETFSEFVADPFYLYFIDSTANNAYACRQSNGINVIGISKKLFELILERTLHAAPLFQYAIMSTVENLAQILTVPIDYYIFIFARHFLFYHELAH